MKHLIMTLALLCSMQMSAQTYTATWSSLRQKETPEWFKDAKLGMWAHWGFQSNPEAGNWYTRNFYFEDLWQYQFHVNKYGSPKDYGVKELLRDWQAENWNPQEIVDLYKSVGAKYFFTLGNFHDNVDLWDSEYQEWNSVNFGPHRDIVGGWAEAVRAAGLPFGVSFHAAHAWTWLEGSRKWDGLLTKEDGAGTWWEGYDPQKLYVQNHALSVNGDRSDAIYGQWDWGNGASQPDATFKQNFVDRTIQCIDKYSPDIIYFDDNVLPFYYSDENPGLEIAAHFYNKQSDGVMTCKGLNSSQQQALTWDIERGIPSTIQENYWQTCTCLGEWFYSRSRYDNGDYKSAQLVVQMLMDIISKNGNMLLSVPLRGDGTPDNKELAILQDLKGWLDVNGEAVFGTRVWKTFGEGPIADAADPNAGTSFNEGTNYTADEVRYVQKDGAVYAVILAWPTTKTFTFETFSPLSEIYGGRVESVELLGFKNITFEQDLNGLTITLPGGVCPHHIAPAFKISLTESDVTLEQQWNDLIAQLETFIATEESLIESGESTYTMEELEPLKQALADAKDKTPSSAALAELRNAWKVFTKAQKPYTFVATEWQPEYSPEAYTYDTEANTISCTLTGARDIHLQYKGQEEKYITPEQHYLVVRGTGLNGQNSRLWWLNHHNRGQDVAPLEVRTDGDVTTIIWDMYKADGLDEGLNKDDITILYGGTGFTTLVGMTKAAGAAKAVYTYIGFMTADELEIEEVETMVVPYTFDSADWQPEHDAQDYTYNADGTVSVKTRGERLVNFYYVGQPNIDKYITPEQKYFVIKGKGLNVSSKQSMIYWFNHNLYYDVDPTEIWTEQDGTTAVAWDISASISKTNNTVVSPAFGVYGNYIAMTKANDADAALISYIGFDETTGETYTHIGEVNSEKLKVKMGEVFDLAGRKLSTLNTQLSTLPKGFLIMDRKKVFMK